MMLISDAEDVVRQRACWELGKAVSQKNPERIKDFFRRLVWRLSPESGEYPFGVPEAFGEIGNRAPQQVSDFVSVVLQFLADEILRPGLLQAAGRIGQRIPDALAPHIDEISSFLHDCDPIISGNALLALYRVGEPHAGETKCAIENDSRRVKLFCRGEFREVRLCELADQDCLQEDTLCFISHCG